MPNTSPPCATFNKINAYLITISYANHRNDKDCNYMGQHSLRQLDFPFNTRNMRVNRTVHIKKGNLKDVYTFIFRNHNYLMILMMYICIYLQQIKHKKIVTVYTGVRQIVGVGGKTPLKYW